jgi:AcrR family transcriptional regulator
MASPSRTKKKVAAEGSGVSGDASPRRDAEVLATAAEVFARRGYSTATIQDVADELGILKGSLYYYIDSKEDLLFRLLNGVHDDVDAIVAKVAEIEGLNPLERIGEFVREQTTFNLRNLLRISVYYNDLDQLGEDRRKETLKRTKGPEDFITKLVREGQGEGLIDDSRDARVLMYTVFAAIVWPYRWFKPRGGLKLNDVVESCVTFVEGGLTKR